MAPAPLHGPFAETARFAQVDERGADPDHLKPRMLRPKGRPEIGLVLRPARPSDGDALQSYVRGLSPPSRYNRFLGVINELSAIELARALAANGRDALTLLLTLAADGRERVVGEARTALLRGGRAWELSLSIADDWRGVGVGSALLGEIERKAADNSVEWLFGDTLRTNDEMIALGRARGFQLAPGLEPRLVRIQKTLDAATDPLCWNWSEISNGAEAPAG